MQDEEPIIELRVRKVVWVIVKRDRLFIMHRWPVTGGWKTRLWKWSRKND